MSGNAVNKNLLLLGASGTLGVQTAFKWALAGYQVIAIGTGEQQLRQIKREVDDLRGQFHYYVLDLTHTKQVRRTIAAIFNQFFGVHDWIHLVGEYGLTTLSPIPLAEYDPVHPTTDTGLIQFYHYWLETYHHRQAQGLAAIALEQVIEVITIRQRGRSDRLPHKDDILHLKTTTDDTGSSRPVGRSLDHPSVLPTPTPRFSRLYLEELDSVTRPRSTARCQWTTIHPDAMPPVWIVTETCRLLSQPQEDNCSDWVIRMTVKDGTILSYSLSGQKPNVLSGAAHCAAPLKTLGFCPDAVHPLLQYPVEPQTICRLGEPLMVYVQQTSRGRAVFAQKSFNRGELILRTTGKRVPYQTEHTIQIDWHDHLEPDAPVRLINHSCDPTAGVKTNPEGLPDFYAFKDIKKDEEITFDYAMTEFCHQGRSDPALEFDLTCRCGTPICRGKLGYYGELPTPLRQHYQGFISAYLLQRFSSE